MIFLLFLFLAPFVNCDRVVQTNSGPIRGISLDTKNVEAFFGIPYAEPPVGNLRFSKPIPKSPWTETLEANKKSSLCIQPMIKPHIDLFNESMNTDEDCLYLNLWVPKTEKTSKPVMVFIHGGGFMCGSANLKMYDGSSLSQYGDVIVASMNYRVGTLGFFSAFIDEAAGSMGMYDQVMALQWIKDNAKYFGGDPDNIVLFGESAGAFSVSLHMVSPLSKHLFKRSIQQSGSVVNPIYSDDNEMLYENSEKISKLLGCSESAEELRENPKKIVECMKSLPAEKFPEADEELFKNFAILIPRVGDDFLPANPIDLFRKGEFKDSEVLLGLNKDEGSFFIAFMLGYENDDMFGETIDPYTFNETTAREMVQAYETDEHSERVIESYFAKVKVESRYSYLNAINDIVGDCFITCAAVFQADFQSLKRNPVYFYRFDYRSPSSPFSDWVGVPHFDEVQYVFGNPFFKVFSEYEKELSKDMMDMWITFAKTGNPSIPGGLKWPQYTYEDPKYVIINRRDSIGIRPDSYRCEAWRELYRAKIDNKSS